MADGAVVAVGALDGSFHCVDQATGQARWVSREASYTIESAACLAGDTFFFGAWDTFVYALSARDGSLRWKTPAEGTAVPPPATTARPIAQWRWWAGACSRRTGT